AGNLVLAWELRLAGDRLEALRHLRGLPEGLETRLRTQIRLRGEGLGLRFRLHQHGRLLVAEVTGRSRGAACGGRGCGGRLGRCRHLTEQLATGRERVRLIARPEGLVFDLTQLGVSRAVLPLQIEVFAYRVVEYAHDARFDLPRRGQSLGGAAWM